jgi:hypothetical protein
MVTRRHRWVGLVLLLGLTSAALSGCSSSGPSDPKQAVIAMFGAMEKNDMGALAHLLDLAKLMENVNEDYALQSDNPRVITNPKQILEDLTGEGLTKKRWFSYQRIINKTELMGETATVEVTFVDKEQSKAYLTKFGLHIVNGKWKIYSFKTYQDRP